MSVIKPSNVKNVYRYYKQSTTVRQNKPRKNFPKYYVLSLVFVNFIALTINTCRTRCRVLVVSEKLWLNKGTNKTFLESETISVSKYNQRVDSDMAFLHELKHWLIISRQLKTAEFIKCLYSSDLVDGGKHRPYKPIILKHIICSSFSIKDEFVT